MSDSARLIRLKPNWLSVKQQLDEMGLDGMRLIAVKHGVELGHYTDECDYQPDQAVWAYYFRMPSRS